MSGAASDRPSRSLRIKIIGIVIAVVVTYAVLDHLMQRVWVQPSFAKLEEQEARKDLKRVEQALLAEIDNVDARCVDLASWDETLAFVRNYQSPVDAARTREIARYQAANLGPNSFKNGNVNLLYIVDCEGRVCFGRIRDLETGQELQLRELSGERLFASTHPMLVKQDPDDPHSIPRPISGLTMTELGPMFVASRPILSSRGDGPWAGTMIVGRLLSKAVVERLRRRTEVYFDTYRLDQGDLPALDAQIVDDATSSRDYVIQERGDQQLAVFTTLADMRHSPALLVRADVPRDISQKGATVIQYALVSTIAAGFLLLLVLLAAMRRIVLDPIGRLTRHVVDLGHTDDMSARLRLDRNDEIGLLSREFDSMTEKLERSRAQVVEAARAAGMSEIATGILHNVGNVLNSVNVSANFVAQRVQGSRLSKLEKLTEMVEAQGDRLGKFILENPKGKHVAPFLGEVTRLMRGDHEAIAGEIKSLSEGIEHIRKLVDSQQALAGKSNLIEAVRLEDQIELALSIAARATSEHASIVVERAIACPERVLLDRHKLVQVLVNLLKNARESIDDARVAGVLRVGAQRSDGRLRIEITDNGLGIPPENLTRVFNHGFTTKKHGHGFGLHSSANAATEMGGRLSAQSDGPGRGATFVLELPFEPAATIEGETACNASTTAAS
jgi:sensor domain CHASE-containing protein/nitrogen-specific signal transduction histidine kinase